MENEATTKTPIPARPGFHNFASCTLIFALPTRLSLYFFVPLGLSGQDPRSTIVERPLQISLFFAKQSQCQNGQDKHKYSKNKGLGQRTTNNDRRILSKTNPIKPNSPAVSYTLLWLVEVGATVPNRAFIIGVEANRQSDGAIWAEDKPQRK
jgi:hypothetical protein